MLLGEHAVVYGYPCIVTAVSERLFVTDGTSSGDTRFLDKAIAAWGDSKTTLSATCAFSGKYGLGSSSAVTVAALKYLRPDAPDPQVFDAAYKIVLDIQGAGSGFDVAAATYGGTLYYIKNKIAEPLAMNDIPLIVGYTGVKADTKTLVEGVAAKRTKEPEKVERIFQAIAKIVEDAKTKMLEGDWERVGRLMDFNQEYLRDLGVSSEKLETLIAAAKHAGAWGAKLSGAGGGDCMIALAPSEKRQAVEEAIIKAGGEVVHLTPNAPGVRMETTDNQDEMFIVVDGNDNILGYKTRFECHRDNSLIHRTVGALIFNRQGQLLLQKRSMTKDMEAGMWGISAAGHVARGQTDEEAVHRELQEELGIDTPLVFFKKFIIENSGESERVALYKGKSDGPFTPDPQEVADIRFFDPREITLFVASKKLVLTDAATKSLQEAGIL
ncbi:hypothetical protein A2363_00235 [Candidatus Gottesmanbacteria bacterium RIFOXYB1_FULL_47_11]|uniref:Nudix hydrolase domain-containing protein n=1 Tax=Candidatus Gottesmanbacteria bacterium RIFOXYB1_FULL_47_11 TaxID=1798401 RepID=A0A1F6BD55_9BACT|nr:MAG: hypothetical protein A2363_00235 [Candidatus Gottesmanbacteria bacterium RIFOXYB1_FULL_47_11]